MIQNKKWKIKGFKENSKSIAGREQTKQTLECCLFYWFYSWPAVCDDPHWQCEQFSGIENGMLA